MLNTHCGLSSARFFCSANAIPTTSLCVKRGKIVWVLYVDATCINYDGNIFDATLLAMVAALRNSTFTVFSSYDIVELSLRIQQSARLPKATYNDETERASYTRKTMLPLQINKIPISSSFGIFDSYVCPYLCTVPFGLYRYHRTNVLADPTTFEEPLLDATFTVTLDDQDGIVSVVQLGMGTASVGLAGAGSGDVMTQCITAAQSRCQTVRKVLENASPN